MSKPIATSVPYSTMSEPIATIDTPVRRGRGRPVGSLDLVPRARKTQHWPTIMRQTVLKVCRDICTNDPHLIETAFLRGLRAPAPKSFPYLQLLLYYALGKPPDTLTVEGPSSPPIILVTPGALPRDERRTIDDPDPDPVSGRTG